MRRSTMHVLSSASAIGTRRCTPHQYRGRRCASLRGHGVWLGKTNEQPRTRCIIDECGPQSLAVTGGELFVGPGEAFTETGILLLEGDVGDGAGVSVDA